MKQPPWRHRPKPGTKAWIQQKRCERTWRRAGMLLTKFMVDRQTVKKQGIKEHLQ